MSAYVWFTDIEFNPQKSVNCQARSAAIYKLLQEKEWFDVVKSREAWLSFHKDHVKS